MESPHRADLFDPAALATLGHIEVVARWIVDGFLSGLHPAISLRSGDYDPSVDPSDPSYVVPASASAADTSGVMREATVDQQYIYNLAAPSTGPAGALYTVLIRPFGGSSPTLYAVLKIKK